MRLDLLRQPAAAERGHAREAHHHARIDGIGTRGHAHAAPSAHRDPAERRFAAALAAQHREHAGHDLFPVRRRRARVARHRAHFIAFPALRARGEDALDLRRLEFLEARADRRPRIGFGLFHAEVNSERMTLAPQPSHRLCVAPMMDWTDRHCRYFLRQVSSRARLYTEMITTGALIHGDVDRHLAFSEQEHPVALQLGGSEPDELAQCAKLGEQYGYDEINLNIGCPSERVQRGAFGACLMAEPQLVADCVRSIREAVTLPVTVKHRVGINQVEEYAFVRDFVGTVSEAGCRTFIVHARNAVLKGLSPKENREIPPRKYDFVYRL